MRQFQTALIKTLPLQNRHRSVEANQGGCCEGCLCEQDFLDDGASMLAWGNKGQNSAVGHLEQRSIDDEAVASERPKSRVVNVSLISELYRI